jgi:hypothetical protein
MYVYFNRTHVQLGDGKLKIDMCGYKYRLFFNCELNLCVVRWHNGAREVMKMSMGCMIGLNIGELI